MEVVKTTPEELLKGYKERIESLLFNGNSNDKVKGLYEPIEYLLQIGGKRLRPCMVLAGCEGIGGNPEDALHAALAIEVFHNFSLMHDDIMDEAPLRRGEVTVHEKWNANAAILSGDAMLVQAYQYLAKSSPQHLPKLLTLFNTTAIEVCEGQQLDMEFETRTDVEIEEYMEMIRLKTSVLLAASIQMGMIIGGASEEQHLLGYEFGLEAGLAFQLQDDYLDAFGDPTKFGKQIGGDILSDKKTHLYLTCRANASSSQLAQLDKWVGKTASPQEKIEEVKALFVETGAANVLQEQMRFHYVKALSALSKLKLTDEGKQLFNFLAELVHIRNV